MEPVSVEECRKKLMMAWDDDSKIDGFIKAVLDAAGVNYVN